MKCISKITREMFVAATGNEPIQDDLERCNCKKAGNIGHSCCGWNYKTNLPRFMSSDEGLFASLIDNYTDTYHVLVPTKSVHLLNQEQNKKLKKLIGKTRTHVKEEFSSKYKEDYYNYRHVGKAMYLVFSNKIDNATAEKKWKRVFNFMKSIDMLSESDKLAVENDKYNKF